MLYFFLFAAKQVDCPSFSFSLPYFMALLFPFAVKRFDRYCSCHCRCLSLPPPRQLAALVFSGFPHSVDAILLRPRLFATKRFRCLFCCSVLGQASLILLGVPFLALVIWLAFSYIPTLCGHDPLEAPYTMGSVMVACFRFSALLQDCRSPPELSTSVLHRVVRVPLPFCTVLHCTPCPQFIVLFFVPLS